MAVAPAMPLTLWPPASGRYVMIGSVDSVALMRLA